MLQIILTDRVAYKETEELIESFVEYIGNQLENDRSSLLNLANKPFQLIMAKMPALVKAGKLEVIEASQTKGQVVRKFLDILQF